MMRNANETDAGDMPFKREELLSPTDFLAIEDNVAEEDVRPSWAETWAFPAYSGLAEIV